MQHLVFEFDNEKDCRMVVDKFWEGLDVTGEMSIRPLSGDRWRLELNTERELRDSQLEKFAAWRVEAGA